MPNYNTHERPGGLPITVKMCHILNEPTKQGIGTSQKNVVVNKACTIVESSVIIHSPPLVSRRIHYVVRVVATLMQFGLEGLAVALEAVNSVHEIWNLLSLKSNFHQPFNRSYLWFEGTNKAHYSETFHL